MQLKILKTRFFLNSAIKKTVVGVITCAIFTYTVYGVTAQFPPPSGKLNLALTVTDFSGVNRLGEVVSGGVPLPKGLVKDLNVLRIVDETGKSVPCQFSVIDRWWSDPEKSLRWVMVDFRADVFADESAVYYLRDDNTANTPKAATPMKVEEDSDKVTVITGPLKFTVSKKAFNLFDEAWYDQNGDGQFSDEEQYIFSSPENGGVLTSGDWPEQGYKSGDLYYSSAKPPARFEIEDIGPCRVAIMVEGTHYALQGGAPDGLYDYRVRIQAYAGYPGVKVAYSLGNMKTAAEWEIPPIRNFEVGTRLSFTGEHAAQFMLDADRIGLPPMYREGSAVNFAYPATPGYFGRRIDDSRVSLYQDSSGGEEWRDLVASDYNKRIFGGDTVPGVTFRGFKITKDDKDERTGWRSAGQIDIRSSGNRVEVPLRYAIDPTISTEKASRNRGVTLTVRDFRQRYPKGLYGEKGRVAAKIFPEESGRNFHIERSSCRTHEMQFFFHGPVLYARHYDWLRLTFENPLLPRATSEWYARVQAWDMGVARTAAIPKAEFDKERMDGVRIGEEVYGWISPWNPGGQHWNECSQFAPWATKGDWKAFQIAEVSTHWVRDLVRTQTECPSEDWKRFALYLMGWGRLDECKIKQLVYPGYKDTTAWIGIPDSGHAGQLMLLEHYRLTGDRFSREAVERLGMRGRAYPWKSQGGRDPETDPTLMSDNRYAAWPLFNSMQWASLTGDQEHMKEARKVVLAYRNAVRFSPIGWMCLTINDQGSPEVYGRNYKVEKRGPGASAVYANFQFGLVVIALAKYYEETGDEDARDTILATCDVLVNRTLSRAPDGKPTGWTYCWGDVWGINGEQGNDWNDDVIAAIGYGYRVSGRRDFLEALQSAYEKTKYEYKPFAQIGYACVVHPREDQIPPAAITDLKVKADGNGSVQLTWRAPGDDGDKGRAAIYQVKYSKIPMVERVTDWPPPGVTMPPDKAGYRKLANEHRARICSFNQANNVDGEPVPGKDGTREQFAMNGLEPGKYWFAVKSLDAAQNISDISNVVEVEVK